MTAGPRANLLLADARGLNCPLTRACCARGSAVADALKEVLPRERRRERVTERALAERARLSAQLIRKLEKGSSLPSIPVLVVLAWSLDLDPRELLDRLLRHMNYPDGCRPILVNRAPPDIPRESVKAIPTLSASRDTGSVIAGESKKPLGAACVAGLPEAQERAAMSVMVPDRLMR